MVVAVSVVAVMQPAVNQIVNVVAVRNRFVRAVFIVRAAASRRRADCRILVADFQNALVNVRIVNRMQMPVVQKIGVIAVLNLCMPAICAVRVRVVFVNRMCHKIKLLNIFLIILIKCGEAQIK